jgi:hypothetical protein
MKLHRPTGSATTGATSAQLRAAVGLIYTGGVAMPAPSAIQPDSPLELLRAALCAATAGHRQPGDQVRKRLAAADPTLTPLVRATIHTLVARLREERLRTRVLPGDPSDLDEALDRLLPGAADVVWDDLERAFGALAVMVIDRDCQDPPPDLPARPRLLEVMEHTAGILEVAFRRNDLVEEVLADAAARLTGVVRCG